MTKFIITIKLKTIEDPGLKNEIKELREKADKAGSQTDKFNLYNASCIF